MAKHRTHSIAFKRQIVQEYLAGETLHGLARRHDLSRTLIRICVDKYEAGAFDEDAEAASTIQEYEARIATLERLVVEQVLVRSWRVDVRVGPHIAGVAVRQIEDEEVRLARHTPDHRTRLAEVRLPMAGRMDQRHEHLRWPQKIGQVAKV